MSIIRKVKAVEKVFSRLEVETNALKEHTGMHCLPGCGRCCMKPDIEASPLEFLPLAYSWFEEGKAYEKLEELDSNPMNICLVFKPVYLSDRNGSCGDYEHRGLICRLFGYATSRDKNGERRLVTCNLIKQEQPDSYQKAVDKIADKEYLPSFINYYQQLVQIDFRLANEMLPINKAIKVALHEVIKYYSYRPFPKKRKAS
ncbi:MAG: YkgJ family cysteine cluster protein [Bacteroidota bacterium]